MLLISLEFLITLALAAILAGAIRTRQVQHDPRAKVFLSGTVPNPKPDGLYRGSVPGRTVSWLGKKFSAQDSTGINMFDDGNHVTGERYPFKTSIGKGLCDTDRDVLKIDYNIRGNPFWLRLILDEIVEIAPGQYLGKLELRIIPGYPFALAYFELKK